MSGRTTSLIRPATAKDTKAVVEIYNHYIQHTLVTFEEDVIDAAEMTRRMTEVQEANLPWLVAEIAGKVVGYAYASLWQKRRGYRFSAEVTVYLAPDAGGHGIGSQLYRPLLDDLRVKGFKNAIGGIGLPNDASVKLHEKFGFKKVANYEKVGVKFGTWMDVGYWQCQLEETK